MTVVVPSYKGFRYPWSRRSLRVVVSPVPLSFREVEEMMLARGIVVSYETIRAWRQKCHLDEVFININGKDSLLVASH